MMIIVSSGIDFGQIRYFKLIKRKPTALGKIFSGFKSFCHSDDSCILG